MTCACGATREDPEHFLLFCPKYANKRSNLIRTIHGNEFTQESNGNMTRNLLSGNSELSVIDNKIIFEAVADFIISTNRL